jgi:uncharacterized protein with HEPN domain
VDIDLTWAVVQTSLSSLKARVAAILHELSQ